MEITEVRVQLAESRNGRLKAWASVTLDGVFAVRDIKVVEGGGRLFIAMPNRKEHAPCPDCRGQNPVHANFCHYCSKALQRRSHLPGERMYFDLAFPTTNEFRLKLTDAVLQEYHRMLAGRGCECLTGPAFVTFSEVPLGLTYDHQIQLSDLQPTNGESGQAPAQGLPVNHGERQQPDDGH